MNYLTDAESFARDLTEAADRQDWDSYRNIQAQLAAETAQAILARAAQAEQGRRGAIAEVSRTHPDFESFRESESYREILSEHRRLAEAISVAESDISLQESLPELYRLVANCAKAANINHSQRVIPLQQEVRGEFTHSLRGEEAIFRSTQDSKRVDLSPRNRKALIAELESRGVADTEF